LKVALLYIDGFEGHPGTASERVQYGISNLPRWLSFPSGFSTAARTTQATPANSRSLSNTSYDFNRLQIPPLTEVISGFGFRYSTTATHNMVIFGGTSYAAQGIALALVGSTGAIRVAVPDSNGGVGTAVATSAPCMTSDAWYYVEARVKLGTTTGEVEVRVNGSEVLNLTGINTASGSISSYQSITFGSYTASSGIMFWDDFYVCDTTGDMNNSFIGPLSVFTLMPTANGSSTQLTPVGAASNWSAVSETTPNTTTYNETSTNGHKDFYSFQSIPISVGVVQGVMFRARSTTPDNGGRSVKLNIKSGASILATAARLLSLGTWMTETLVAEKDPGGNQWSKASVDSVEGGVEAG
jgi:hypothetical protein